MFYKKWIVVQIHRDERALFQSNSPFLGTGQIISTAGGSSKPVSRGPWTLLLSFQDAEMAFSVLVYLVASQTSSEPEIFQLRVRQTTTWIQCACKTVLSMVMAKP